MKISDLRGDWRILTKPRQVLCDKVTIEIPDVPLTISELIVIGKVRTDFLLVGDYVYCDSSDKDTPRTINGTVIEVSSTSATVADADGRKTDIEMFKVWIVYRNGERIFKRREAK